MRILRANYVLLLISMVLSSASNWFAEEIARTEPWLTIATIALVGLVVYRLRLTPKSDRAAHAHATAQIRVLLLFVIASIISSFQWLTYFTPVDFIWDRLGIDLNDFLQAVNWIIVAAALAQLVIGMLNLDQDLRQQNA